MRARNKRINTLHGFFSSPKLFWAIVILLVLQALWIAFSNRYPMAFDEDYHFGIIKLYAHHLSPFWQHQPAGADMFGAVYREPSYLYHYLLSFPYRLISAVTDSQVAQVIFLRIINVGLFACSLPIFRRVFRHLGISEALTNVILFIFILVPVVPLLAAQINYDNLLIPAVTLLMLWLIAWTQELTKYKRINMRLLLQIIVLCLFASLIKYPFLPFFISSIVLIIFLILREYHDVRKILLNVGFGLTLMTKRMRWVLAILLVLGSGLFIERYGVNAVHYHSPVPDCAQVLSVQHCSAYGPWIRDYTLATSKTYTPHNPAAYIATWVHGMWLRLFFTVDGPATDYQTRGPLVIPAVAAIIAAAISFIAVIWTLPKIWQTHRLLAIPLSIGIFYCIVLFLDGYEAFRRTGAPVAINGRYILPILPYLLLWAGLAIRSFTQHSSRAKSYLAIISILSMIWGGGVLTFILRSSNEWYWQNTTVKTVNDQTRQLIAPVVPGSDKPTQFLP